MVQLDPLSSAVVDRTVPDYEGIRSRFDCDAHGGVLAIHYHISNCVGITRSAIA
ncbi:MAG: hypothetical protein ACTSQQ_07970 [Candidatus Helarchaeota archaeon]